MTEKDNLLKEIIRMKKKEEKLKRKPPTQQQENESNDETDDSFQDLVCVDNICIAIVQEARKKMFCLCSL